MKQHGFIHAMIVIIIFILAVVILILWYGRDKPIQLPYEEIGALMPGESIGIECSVSIPESVYKV